VLAVNELQGQYHCEEDVINPPVVLEASLDRSPLESNDKGWKVSLVTSHEPLKADVSQKFLSLVGAVKARWRLVAEHAWLISGSAKASPNVHCNSVENEDDHTGIWHLNNRLICKLEDYFEEAEKEARKCRQTFSATVSEVCDIMLFVLLREAFSRKDNERLFVRIIGGSDGVLVQDACGQAGRRYYGEGDTATEW